MPNKRYNFFRGKKKTREKCPETDSSEKSENDLDHFLITADDVAILPRVNLANSQVKSIKYKWIKKTEEDKIDLPGTDTKRSNNQATAGKAAMVLTVKQERDKEDVSSQAQASSTEEAQHLPKHRTTLHSSSKVTPIMVTTQSQSQQLQSEIAGRPKISPRSVPPATNATASPVSNEDIASAAAVKLPVQLCHHSR